LVKKGRPAEDQPGILRLVESEPSEETAATTFVVRSSLTEAAMISIDRIGRPADTSATVNRNEKPKQKCVTRLAAPPSPR
jgi:hypothetical protein